MNTMQLTFAHDVRELPRMLAFNYDELKAGLAEYLASLSGKVYQPADIAVAKEDKAAINATRDAIARARIDIKAKAFAEFERKAKELEAMCNTASGEIDAQLKVYEAARRAKKLGLINDAMATQLAEAYPEDAAMRGSQLWNDFVTANCDKRLGGWLNSGTKIDKIRAEIAAEIERVNGELATIQSFVAAEPVAIKTLALDAFMASFTATAAIERITAFKAEQKRIAQAEAEEMARKAATKPAEAVPVATPCADTPVTTDAPKAVSGASGVMTYRLELTGTREQLKRVRALIDELGISYRKI